MYLHRTTSAQSRGCCQHEERQDVDVNNGKGSLLDQLHGVVIIARQEVAMEFVLPRLFPST